MKIVLNLVQHALIIIQNHARLAFLDILITRKLIAVDQGLYVQGAVQIALKDIIFNLEHVIFVKVPIVRHVFQILYNVKVAKTDFILQINNALLVIFSVKHAFLILYAINVHKVMLKFKDLMLELDFNVRNANSLASFVQLNLQDVGLVSNSMN